MILKNKKNCRRMGERGQAMVIAVIFFICISTAAILGLVNPIVRHIAMATSVALSKESFYAAEAGIEDAIYRLKSGLPISSSQTLNIGGKNVLVTVSDELNGKAVTASGNANNYVRKVRTRLVFGDGISFHYGIQAGLGGFYLYNSSSITGNVYSGGPVIGNGNTISGDVISAGATGLVQNIHSNGSVFSHTIKDSIIDKEAFYSSISGSTVSGGLHPGSPDQPTADLPISDEQINEWESYAEAGGTIPASSCTGGVYNITSSQALGPVKIDCSLFIKGNGIVVTIGGPIWVAGNITTQNGPIIKMASSLGSQNVALIADNPGDKAGSGIINIGQNSQFQGSGSPNSFVFIISQNNSAETGGSADAFTMGQSSGALVAYASHGQITLGQSVSVKEATAYKIVLKNTANVVYDTGLPSTLFQSGPSGGFDILKWGEIQ
jgi:hypothetical protein